MRYYRSYMDRQEVSAGTHERLMNLRVERRAPRTGPEAGGRPAPGGCEHARAH